jgi:hypothetical protein
VAVDVAVAVAVAADVVVLINVPRQTEEIHPSSFEAFAENHFHGSIEIQPAAKVEKLFFRSLPSQPSLM